eukprot:TRINITY_DN23540_c0_g2_i1.p1 TRINITY_DN23540_c0_g2~~TRINITY_DN23540_c0_g2_i1.p1  ORF type:complete len:142 (+),score=8.89 TRINITY_DN23540_c0_g2_i1:313-738(+)
MSAQNSSKSITPFPSESNSSNNAVPLPYANRLTGTICRINASNSCSSMDPSLFLSARTYNSPRGSCSRARSIWSPAILGTCGRSLAREGAEASPTASTKNPNTELSFSSVPSFGTQNAVSLLLTALAGAITSTTAQSATSG